MLAMIRVLPKDNDFGLGKLGKLKGIEHIGSGRIDGLPALAFGANGGENVLKIGLGFFCGKGIVPSLHRLHGVVLWDDGVSGCL